MKLSRQHEELLKIHRDLNWHCSTEYEYMRDHRKRLSELREHLAEKGYFFNGKRCTMHNHKGNIFMRRAEKIEHVIDVSKKVAPNPLSKEEYSINQERISIFENYKCQCSVCKDCPCDATEGHHEVCPVLGPVPTELIYV